jgi:hypothetical protein
MCGRLKLFPQFSPNLVHCQPPVEQFVLFPNQLHLGTALEGARRLLSRQKIATFIPSTFVRSSTPDLEMSAHGPPLVYAHNTGNPFINHNKRQENYRSSAHSLRDNRGGKRPGFEGARMTLVLGKISPNKPVESRGKANGKHAQSQNTQITIASIAPSSRAFATRICRRYRPLSNPNRPSVTAIGGDRCRAHNRRFRRMNVCAASINRSISRLAR